MQLVLAAMLFGLSRATRWRSLRWLALVALWGGLFAAAAITFTVDGLSDSTRAAVCRLTITLSSLHAISWLYFLRVEEQRGFFAWERAMIAAAAACALLVQVPGLLLDERVAVHRVSWLGGISWYDVQPSTAGLVLFVGYLICLTFVAVRVARHAQHGANRALMLFALLAGQVNDALASTDVLELPYVLDLVYLGSVVVMAAVVTRELVSSAVALEQSSERLAAAQAALVRRERLAALGELSAVIAHEVRNPVAVVWNAVSRLKQLVPKETEAATLLRLMGEESERLERMVGDLLDLTRPSPSSRQPVQLGELVEAAIAAARDAWKGERADIAIEVEPGLPTTQLDAEQVRRAVVNLVTNALQATRRREAIKVRVFGEGERQCVEVTDDGPGVPPEQRAQIFAPFFTTRAQGTGLGLAIVQRVAEAHGGQVGVGSAPGGGAVFSLVLPRAPLA